MKFIINTIRMIVGATFIFSGFVKLIDPEGFAIKLNEYFSEDVLNLTFLSNLAYAIGVFVVIVEILLGILLILGYKKNLTVASLIAMTVFFGFLTFYSAYFNKVTDCGCFGDAIKFTPWQSFAKDMVLLFLAVVLWFYRKYIFELISPKISLYISVISVIACLALVYYTKTHLPIIDFRPYKIGNSIPEGMTIPQNAQKPIYDYMWKFKVNGKEQIITTQGSYPSVDGEFIEVDTKLVKAGYLPPIHDFTIEKDGEDFTQDMLKEEKLILIISQDLQKADWDGFKNIKSFTDNALKKGYKVIGMSPSVDEYKSELNQYNLNFDFYFTDQTTLKTMIRCNPGVIVLEKGVVKNKSNYRQCQSIKLK